MIGYGISEEQNERVNIADQKTKLVWDGYIDYLIEAIEESHFMKRAECKPMQTEKDDLEAHVSSRASHVRNAALIAKRIAKALGLNYKYIYAAMLMHDAGHPFSAHKGEEIFQGIGELYNTEYFHHNAKGVQVVISENICEKAISKIPNISMRPDLRKKLEEEFYYFLDVIVSHDGEAGAAELGDEPVEYPDIKTAVNTKVQLSNSTNNFKFIAQTVEGRIAKYADVIAYLTSDVQDRFRIGTQKNFDDDYLEFIGEILAKDFAKTREEKIEIADNIIDNIKETKLRELVQDAKELENLGMLEYANEIISVIQNKGIDYETETDKANEVLEEYVSMYREKHEHANMSQADMKFLNSDLQKVREFVGKKLRIRTSVVEDITSRIQEALINDLLKESEAKGKLGFSDDFRDLFFRAKKLNYRHVFETAWDYQREALPSATFKLVHMVALCLRKTGAIANKFYDRAVRKYIKDEEALKYLNTLGYTDDREYQEYKKKHNIRDIKSHNNKYTSQGGRTKGQARNELFESVYDYVQNSGQSFAMRYENTFKAVEHQIISKVKNALGRLPEAEVKKRKTYIDIFDNLIAKEEEIIRKQIIKKFSKPRKKITIDEITDEQMMEFASELIERERSKMEGKMAVQYAIDFLSGMTDKAIQKTAVQIGVLDEEELSNSKRGVREDEKNKYNTSVKQTPTAPGDSEGR